MNHYRHGDISFHPVTKLPKGTKTEERERYIVAYGEATGHHHEITFPATEKKIAPKVTIHTCDDGRRFIELDYVGHLDHPEHALLTLEKGIYEIHQERTFDYFENSIKKVID